MVKCECPVCCSSVATPVVCFVLMCAGIYGTFQVSPRNEFVFSSIVSGIVLTALVALGFITRRLYQLELIPYTPANLETIILKMFCLIVIQTLLIWACTYLGLKMEYCVANCDSVKGGFASAFIVTVCWSVFVAIKIRPYVRDLCS